MTMVKTGSFQIPLPPETIAHWPLVGKLLHSVWMQAVTDLPDLIQKYLPEIKQLTLSLLSELAGAGMGFLMFIVALMIAGILMAFGESGGRSAVQIVSRICGPVKGPKITSLCTYHDSRSCVRCDRYSLHSDADGGRRFRGDGGAPAPAC